MSHEFAIWVAEISSETHEIETIVSEIESCPRLFYSSQVCTDRKDERIRQSNAHLKKAWKWWKVGKG